MTPTNHTKNVTKIHENRPTTKAEPEQAPAVEKALVPVTPAPEVTADVGNAPATTTPKKADDSADKRAFTIMIPAKNYKLLGLIAKVEDKSISEVILDAVEKAGLKERAKAALVALSADLGE